MKITAVNVYILKLNAELRPIIVEVVTASGIKGIGEAAVAFGQGGLAAAAMVRELATEYLIGRNAGQIELLWSDMYDLAFWTKGGGPIVYSAMSAVEQALWDIKGKSLGVPVYELFGGRVRDKIHCYANGWSANARTPQEFAKAAERPLRDGFRALKCYPLALIDDQGRFTYPMRRSIDRADAEIAFQKVRELRRAAGPDIEIMVDLSGVLAADECVRLCRRIEEFDLTFIEEPLDPNDTGSLLDLCRRINTPIALGERVYTRYGFRDLIAAHGIRYVQPDIGNTGGLMETRKIAAMAEAHGMRIAPHNSSSPLLTASSVQLDACTTNFAIQEVFPYLHEDPIYVEYFDNPPERNLKNGKLPVPELPGLGIGPLTDKISACLEFSVTL